MVNKITKPGTVPGKIDLAKPADLVPVSPMKPKAQAGGRFQTVIFRSRYDKMRLWLEPPTMEKNAVGQVIKSTAGKSILIQGGVVVVQKGSPEADFLQDFAAKNPADLAVDKDATAKANMTAEESAELDAL